MADSNGKENKTKAGYSAQESRGRPIPRLDSQHRPSKLPRQTHPSHLAKPKKRTSYKKMYFDLLHELLLQNKPTK